MRFSLKPHPQSLTGPVRTIDVEVARDGDALALRYLLHGDINALLLPAPSPAARADELWRSTCFEAFLGSSDAQSYLEFNFAPSTQWAAYAFDDRRVGMREAPIAPRDIVCWGRADQVELRARVPLAGLPRTSWRLGLSAVIEAAGGATSYWALAHPDGPPDFHHADCFAARIPAA